MRKIQFIIFGIIFNIAVKAQVYKAGTVFPSYTDISPDTMLNYNYYSGPSSTHTMSFNIDINNDFQNDFQLYEKDSHGGGGGSGFIRIKSLNVNSFKRYKGSFILGKIAEPLNYMDSINAKTAMWDTATQYLCFNAYTMGSRTGITNWTNAGDLYLGLKYQNSLDTIYGWIRLDCKWDSLWVWTVKCYVKDFSSTVIDVGVKEMAVKEFVIFPNPISNNFYLKNIDVSLIDLSKVAIRDVYSKELNCSIESSGNTDLKIKFPENTSEGCYFLSIQLKNGSSFTKKLIKIKE